MNQHPPIPFLVRLAAEGRGSAESRQLLEYDYAAERLVSVQTPKGTAVLAVGTFSEFTKANGDPTSDEQSDR